MKVAICVGHSRSGDSGAVSVGDVSEWHFNRPIAQSLKGLLTSKGFDVLYLDQYQGSGYSSSMSWVADQINEFGADIAVELHFNAATASARGFEYLYWSTSTKGMRLARAFHNAHEDEFPNCVSRGIKPKTYADRGSGFLSKPRAVSCILEPFFGSNNEEWELYSKSKNRLAIVYANAICNYFGVETSTKPRPKPELTLEERVKRIEDALSL